jgi:hypothetical protein
VKAAAVIRLVDQCITKRRKGEKTKQIKLYRWNRIGIDLKALPVQSAAGRAQSGQRVAAF